MHHMIPNMLPIYIAINLLAKMSKSEKSALWELYSCYLMFSGMMRSYEITHAKDGSTV